MTRFGRSLAPVILLLAAPLALGQGTAAPAAPQTGAAPAPAAAPAAPRPHEDVIKLWKANLSEEFIKRKIESEGVVFDLSVDDVVACKAANLPESLIETMLATKKKAPSAPAAALAPAAAKAGTPAPFGAPPAPGVPAANLAAAASRTWEGVVRRNAGVVIFKSRWDVGTLTFKDEKLSWLDADEEGKNLIIPGKAIKEQFIVCLKAGNDCFEWGFKTEDGEYRFRDVSWDRGESKKPEELHQFFQAIYPSLLAPRYPADKK